MVKPESDTKRLERLVETWLHSLARQGQIPPFLTQFRFDLPNSRRTFDFAWPDVAMALEVEGATWSGGKHGRGSGIESDLYKHNDALLLGWEVYRVTSSMVREAYVIDLMRKAFRRWRAQQR